MARFVVTEIEGYKINLPISANVSSGGYRPPGLSVQVIDTAWNHRVVFTRAAEGGSATSARLRVKIRNAARAFCDAQNAASEQAVAA